MTGNHLQKVNDALKFIEEHLTEKLNLERVAHALHYSKYHLHRAFANTVGLTLHDYIKRRKLTEAAKLLVFSRKPIVEIAAIAGYETQQAFTNIFKSMYKQSPNQYRNNEKFYPLQLLFKFNDNCTAFSRKKLSNWPITFAEESDLLCWMDLVRLVIDGFPHLYEDDYAKELIFRIKNKQALILKDGETAIGIMLFYYETGSIDFMGTHPLFHDMGIPKAFLNKLITELTKEKKISTTTYRAGDKADTGQRQEIKNLGFAEAELLVELGYPTQRFILSKEALDVK